MGLWFVGWNVGLGVDCRDFRGGLSVLVPGGMGVVMREWVMCIFVGMRRFRVSSGGHYFWCYVFDGKAEMYAWYVRYREVERRRGGREESCSDGLDFKALVMPYERVLVGSVPEVRHKNIGTCLFYRDALGAGLVAHEMLHCAMWYDRLVNGNECAVYGSEIGDDEERLAYLLTDFTAEFVRKAYKIGLY